MPISKQQLEIVYGNFMAIGWYRYSSSRGRLGTERKGNIIPLGGVRPNAVTLAVAVFPSKYIGSTQASVR